MVTHLRTRSPPIGRPEAMRIFTRQAQRLEHARDVHGRRFPDIWAGGDDDLDDRRGLAKGPAGLRVVSSAG